MQKFERANFEVKEYVESEHYGKFVFEPLERGFGVTIGNALRRVLLSSLPGAAVFSIKVDGVYHEFTAIPGIVEDVTAIILNIKTLIMKIQDDEVYTLRISKQGPGVVTGADIICPEGVEISTASKSCFSNASQSFNLRADHSRYTLFTPNT